MKCAEIKSLLSPYLEGDLDEKNKKLLDEHLAICSGCAKELEGLKAMITGLKKIPEVEPPPYFLEGVHERLKRPSLLAKILRRLFVPVYIKVPMEAIALTATVVIVVVLVQKSEMGKITQPEAPLSGQYEAYYEPKIATQEAPPDKLAVGGIRPQNMSGQVLDADFESTSTGQTGLNHYSLDTYKPDERASVLEGKAEGRVEESAPIFDFKSKGLTQEKSSDLLWKEPIPVDREAVTLTGAPVTPVPEREIILKAQDLGLDKPKLEAILKDLGITNIKEESYPDKVLFSFPILANQLDAFLSKLKDWQLSSLPTKEIAAKEEITPETISIKLTLTTQ